MQKHLKEKILSQAQDHVQKVCASVGKAETKTKKSLEKSKRNFKTLSEADKIVENQLIKYNEKRIVQLSHLKGSPYFVRCDVIFENEKEISRLYFAKFGFKEESVYSWIAPVSSLRFENPGNVSYCRPDGKKQKANLLRKDQFMIVDGQIKFLATENLDNPRELIYQEYFSNRKTGFVLPEIVAQMEKAQDQVIRAHHKGPFIISGPAGSGKTTLALHRIAYLVQAPDLADTYTGKSIIVMVQDTGTKEYFSHLLPELGIDDVQITTFSEWAFEILDLKGKYRPRYGTTETEKDLYEFQKIEILKSNPSLDFRKNNHFSILEKVYLPYFNQDQQKLFQKQKKEKTFDRVDLTLLLKACYEKSGFLGIEKDYYVELKNGSFRKTRGLVPIEYSLCVVDEFQNYLPEQLKLLKSCIAKKNQSILYVGDLAQQVHLGTIRNWNEIEEQIHESRSVVLQKVYRNTKNILAFIKNLGYDIQIPDGLKEGPKVQQFATATSEEEISHIKNHLGNIEFSSAAILAKDENYLEKFKKTFGKDKKIHVMTMNESQGVEFDIVFIVGITNKSFSLDYESNISEKLKEEKQRINKDLLYVALTRAITELHVLGKVKLKDAIKI